MTPAIEAGAAACDPQAVAEFLRALAHPMRLTILCRLLDGEVSVGGFESDLGLRQPNLSQQLAQLREAGLVATRREAKSVFYRLEDQRVRTVLDTLRTVFAPPERVSTAPMAVTAPPAPSAREQAARTSQPAPTECGVFAVAGWPTP